MGEWQKKDVEKRKKQQYKIKATKTILDVPSLYILLEDTDLYYSLNN